MKRFLLPAVLVLAATGCAAQAPAAEPAPSESAVSTPTPVVLKQGTYTFETVDGATGTIEIPGKPNAEVEALRKLAKAPAVTYLTAKVDNRKGTEYVNMYQVSIYTPAGEELTYTGASEFINDITPDDAPAETYNQFIEGYNKHNDVLSPKGVKEFVLTGPTVPAEFTGVTVYPNGAYDPVEATPAP